MMNRIFAPFCACLFAVTLTATAFAGNKQPVQPWVPVGPEGGDARSFGYDPHNPAHMYLGTVSGWIYESNDSGARWTRLSTLADRSDLIIDHILVDPEQPTNILVSAWALGNVDGGVWRSTDSGHTWTAIKDMTGQSVRALTRSLSDPNTLVAGTLQGVYQSRDNGAKWTRISPPENGELHEIESIAIDPKNPDIIYAGTWHLPWKTMDGGKDWFNFKQGIIEDSDVFSIILDPLNPSTVYLSACSGIYKSTDAAAQFNKIQGIPSTARRTRVLKEDPSQPNVVYAGTTEGLYKTSDAGKTWARMTGPEIIVNDVYVDPRDSSHVMLATDRSGVLNSTNASVSFADSNRGIMQRQVSAIAPDPSHPQHIYVSVLNDKTFGGVFETNDGGQSWQQRSMGLAGRDVYSLQVSKDGMLIAGTNHGIMQMQGSGPWAPSGKVVNTTTRSVTTTVRNPKTKKLEKKTVEKTTPSAPEDLTVRVSRVWLDGDTWYAASDKGFFKSTNHGSTWSGGPVVDDTMITRVVAKGGTVFAASQKHLYVSRDDGKNWTVPQFPAELTRVTTIALSPDGQFWVAGPEGVWQSRNNGESFDKVKTLPFNDISNVDWDDATGRVLVTSWHGDLLCGSSDGGKTWKWWHSGWELRSARSANGHLLGASLYNGVVMDPDQLTQADIAPAASTASGVNGAQ